MSMYNPKQLSLRPLSKYYAKNLGQNITKHARCRAVFDNGAEIFLDNNR